MRGVGTVYFWHVFEKMNLWLHVRAQNIPYAEYCTLAPM